LDPPFLNQALKLKNNQRRVWASQIYLNIVARALDYFNLFVSKNSLVKEPLAASASLSHLFNVQLVLIINEASLFFLEKVERVGGEQVNGPRNLKT